MLHCPKCRRPTAGDWEACFKITCGGCNAAFCAWCLQTPADHAHVSNCAGNPHRGNIYGTAQEWAAVRKPTRVAQLRAYLSARVRVDDRSAVVTALAAHLAHAGIVAREVHDEGTALMPFALSQVLYGALLFALFLLIYVISFCGFNLGAFVVLLFLLHNNPSLTLIVAAFEAGRPFSAGQHTEDLRYYPLSRATAWRNGCVCSTLARAVRSCATKQRRSAMAVRTWRML